MKNVIWTVLLFTCTVFSATAQNLVIGAKAPDLKISTYLTTQFAGGKPLLIEFFYSHAKPCVDRLPVFNALAQANASRMDVLLLACEERDQIVPFITGKNYVFSVALDDQSKTFAAFGVQYVPYGVLLDARGRVVWFGNSTRLDQQKIDTALNW